jgi:DtxR family Mn-dependent transcriptional regulator
MATDYNLSPSLEDYLEVIWDLEEVNTVARVKDISESLEVKRSSVTIALRTLGEKGLINYAPYSVITLTDEGKRVGSEIRRKHNLLRNFFTEILGIDIDIANSAACTMEHGLSPSIQKKMEAFVSALHSNNKIKDSLILDMNRIIKEECEIESTLPLLVSLDKLVQGEKGIIYRILGENKKRNRLIDMGLSPNQPIDLLSIDNKNNLEVLVKKFRLSLTVEEASLVLVSK